MYFPFPIYMMTEEELCEARDVLRELDRAQLLQMFGEEGAARYRRVVRQGDDLDWAVARAAWAERDVMEGSLTDAQRDIFFGVGETGIVDQDEVGHYLSVVRDIDGDSALALGASLKWALTKVATARDFFSMQPWEMLSYAHARAGLLYARRCDWDVRMVLEFACEAIRAKYRDPADRDFMSASLRAELDHDGGASLVEWLTRPRMFVGVEEECLVACGG